MKLVKVNKKTIKDFVKKNGVFMAQVAVMGFIALQVDAASATQVGSTTGTTSTFSKITEPLQKVSDTMTGPVARAVGTIGIAGAALATGMNMENQVMKRAIQLAGGTAGAIGAASLLGDASGLLF